MEKNKMKRLLLIELLLAISFSLMAEGPVKKYKNPVVNYSLPDPSGIRAEDGYFYLYATEDIRNLPIHRSKDLVDWEFVGTAFTDETRPTLEPKGNIWAPILIKSEINMCSTIQCLVGEANGLVVLV